MSETTEKTEKTETTEKKKCGCFCKLLKCLLWCIVGLIALTVVVLATMPLWISPLATGVANKVAPELTGTDFHLERFYLNPWTGVLQIEGVKLSNPKGFGESPAFSMKKLDLNLAVTELFSNKLHVQDLVIEDVFASYFSHEGTNNIDAILANLDKALGGNKEEEKAEEPEEEKEKSQMKVIIDHIRISGTKVKLMENDVIPPVPIMTIELNDIGKESDGASFEDVWQALTDAFMKGMSSVGDGLGALGGLIGDGAKSLTGAIGDGAKSLTDALGGKGDGAAKGAADAAKGATDAATDAAKNVTGAVGDAAKSITSLLGGKKDEKADAAEPAKDAAKDESKDAKKDAGDAAKGATDAAKDTANAVGDGVKGAADSAADTAKKATEGVKNLFKGFGK